MWPSVMCHHKSVNILQGKVRAWLSLKSLSSKEESVSERAIVWWAKPDAKTVIVVNTKNWLTHSKWVIMTGVGEKKTNADSVKCQSQLFWIHRNLMNVSMWTMFKIHCVVKANNENITKIMSPNWCSALVNKTDEKNRESLFIFYSNSVYSEPMLFDGIFFKRNLSRFYRFVFFFFSFRCYPPNVIYSYKTSCHFCLLSKKSHLQIGELTMKLINRLISN